MVFATTQEIENVVELLPEDLQNEYKKFKRAVEVLTKEPEPLVGQTPKEVIWTKNKAKLYRYQPNREKRIKCPF